MDYIITKNGYKVLIDPEDWDNIRQQKWNGQNERGYIYAVNNKKVKMHRYLLGVTDPKVFVDHINGDCLDNRKSNLRICTNGENTRNRKKSSMNTTGYKGVYMDKKSGKYMSYCMGNGERRTSEYRIEDYKAALDYNDMAASMHGKFARFNILKDIDMLKMIMTGQMDELDRHLKMCQSDKTANDILQKYQE